MKIVISPDSFKGSLTAKEAGEATADACQSIFPDASISLKPMADGGEGTVETLVFSTNGKHLQAECTGPLGSKVNASYGVLGNEKTAVIETASVAGLIQVPEEKRNPYHTTTYGLGQLIKKVLDDGYTKILIGLGGSATNDGGLGMLQALGARFYDKEDNEVGIYGEDILRVAQVDFALLDDRLKNVEILVACDVDNPLCGPRGASAVYGPQKGATPEQVKVLDEGLRNYANVIEKETTVKRQDTPGAGAAGGLGFALMTIGGRLESGAKLVADSIGLDEELKTADWFITGEGQSDEQTLYGKAPGYTAELAKKNHVPAVLISGSLSKDTEKLRELFVGCFSIMNSPMNLADAMNDASDLLYNQTVNVMHLIDQLIKK